MNSPEEKTNYEALIEKQRITPTAKERLEEKQKHIRNRDRPGDPPGSLGEEGGGLIKGRI